jgi:predicted heme/steroid binding protein
MNPGGLFVSSSGTVGIGNVVPAYTLDVSGTGRFTSTLLVSGIGTFGSSAGSGLRVYGASGTNQWDIYLNSTNLRFSDNTGTGSIVFDRPLSGTSATFSSTITATDAVLTKNGDITIKFNPNNVAKWDLYYNNADGTIGFYDRVGSAFRMTLAQTGAATFSSSVTTNANFINSGPVYSTTGNAGNLLFTNTYPANYNVAQIASVLDGYYYAAKLIFRTADYTNANLLVDRLTITSDGNIAIGTFATAGDKYFGYSHTNGGWGAGSSGLRFESVAVGGNYSQNIYIRTHYYNADSRNAIYCRYDGNVYNFSNSTAWQTTSDIRIKENIRPINNALDKINALNPSHFEYKNKLGQTKTGFVAQEFEQIFPGHVSEGLPNEDYREYFEEGEMMKSIDADLIPYLVKAIQELKAQNDDLQSQINELKAQ